MFTKLLLCCVFFVTNEAARILVVVPVASISHQVVFRPVSQELARRGHEVVAITTDPVFPKGKTPANLTEIDLHDVAYKAIRKAFTNITPKGYKSDLPNQMDVLLKLNLKNVEEMLLNEEIKGMINDKSKQFDLLILEACSKSALVFSHIYKVPVIQLSSFGAMVKMYEPLGAPTHPLVYPLTMNVRANNLSKWDKILELYHHYQIMQVFKEYERAIDETFQKFYGNEIAPVTELEKNIDMLFLNIHPIFEGIRPVPPTVQYVSGLHQIPQNELPKDLKEYLDSSKNGVIYFSFGTNVDPTLLPSDKLEIFLNVLSRLPYDVLWKWNGDELPGRTNNIRISKWLPQSDILRHPNIKVFITQGGLQSTDEAITGGVPLVGIPMLGDQWFNVERYVYHKIGVGLDFETLTEENFRNAVLTVINDESYRQNVIKLRNLMRDEPQSSLDRIIWWVEYVIRNGGAKHLRPPSAFMSWTEYLELELVIILLLIVAVVLLVLSSAVYYIVKFVIKNLRGKIKSD